MKRRLYCIIRTNTNDDTPSDAHAARAHDASDAGSRSPERHAALTAATGGAKRGASGTAPRQNPTSAGRAASCSA